MRRNVLSRITVLSFTALTFAIAACATAPVDDPLEGLTQEQNPAAPEEEQTSAKLPPPTQSTDEPADAGPTVAPPTKDAGTPPKDASTPTPDASTPPTTSDECDPNDPLVFIKLMMESNPQPCPCAASHCCYMGVACLPK